MSDRAATTAIAIPQVRAAYVDELLAGDPQAARAVVDAAVAGGVSAREILLGVLQPALEEVGERWERGEISVAEEHLATAITELVAARLAARLPVAAPRGARVVIACTPGEQHVVGPRFVADLLEARGYDVLLLGPSLPADELVRFVCRRRPSVVGLSTTLRENLPAAAEVFAALRSEPVSALLVAGGRAYGGDERLALDSGADMLANDGGSFVDAIERRLR